MKSPHLLRVLVLLSSVSASPWAIAQTSVNQPPLCSYVDQGKSDIAPVNATDDQKRDLDKLFSDLSKKVRERWYELIPDVARPPRLKVGVVVVKFSISRDGRVNHPTYECSAGDEELDRAALIAVAKTKRSKRLPESAPEPLWVTFTFRYNPPKT